MLQRGCMAGLAAFVAGLIALAPVSHAACSLQNITENALLPELRDAVEREVAARPERYLNGGTRFWAVADADGRVAGHLYGTLHLPHGAATWPPPQAYDAFVKARRLVVEVDAQEAPDRYALRAQQAMLAITQAEPVSLAVERLAPGLLEPELRRYGITHEQADRVGAFALTRRLNGARCLGPHQATTSPAIADLLLQDWARTLGKPVHALESQAAALRATGVDQPRADQVQLLALALRRAQAEDAHVPALIHYYATGRIDRAVAVGLSFRVDPAARPAVEGYDARLYARRNALFAERLDRFLRRDGQLFAAFGAGHLIGTDGVVARLRALGWTVTPLLLD